MAQIKALEEKVEALQQFIDEQMLQLAKEKDEK